MIYRYKAPYIQLKRNIKLTRFLREFLKSLRFNILYILVVCCELIVTHEIVLKHGLEFSIIYYYCV